MQLSRVVSSRTVKLSHYTTFRLVRADAVLYGEPDAAMRLHLLPHGARVLPPIRQVTCTFHYVHKHIYCPSLIRLRVRLVFTSALL